MNRNEMIRLEALRAAPEKVSDDVIRGCSITTAGPALGHGVYLDESFISEAFAQSNSLKLGLKSRFGHPSMCNESLGTTVGRFKNFSISKDGKQLYGDLHFGEYADERFKKHIIGLAKEDPEAFGTSIVFEVGGHYRKDLDGNPVLIAFDEYGREEYEDFEGDPDDLSEELYVVCGRMLGCDFVDEPAANPEGLFSSTTPAGEVSYFLKQHPEIKQLLLDNENVVDIIEKYGVQIKQFLRKEYNMSEQVKTTEEEFEVTSEISHTECEASEEFVELEADVEVEAVEEEPVAEEEAVPEEPELVEAMSAFELKELIECFGAEIATKVFDANGDRAMAQDLYIEKLKSENKALHEEIESLKSKLGEITLELDERKDDGVSFCDSKPVQKRNLARNIKL